MAVQLNFAMDMTVKETLTVGVDAAARPVVNNAEFNVGGRLSASSTPAVTKHVQATIALIAGVKTIDLTSMTGTGGATVTFNGLKVQCIRIANIGTAALTFGKGASSGWSLWASWTVTLPAYSGTGEYPSWMMYVPEGAEDVDGSHKAIDFAGTGTNTFQFSAIAG